MVLIQAFIDFIDWLLGRRERRAEREAYLEALRVVSEASRSQTEMLSKWFESMAATASQTQKGWTVDDRAQYLEEMQREHPELFVGMPAEMKNDPLAMEAWMNEELIGRL